MRIPLALALAAALAAPAQAACVGDCNGDGQVAIGELIAGVGIALGSEAVATCPALDADRDGTVAIGELVSAVDNALEGCPGAATPTAVPPTPTATATPPATPTPAIGPTILFFGVTSADDSYQPPAGTGAGGVPIYERPFGFGFSLVVEARHGVANQPVEGSTYADDGGPPDLQVQATRPLGDGSPAVCDGAAPAFGGVPAIAPPRLDEPAAIADALNDFGCRFIDGQGQTKGRVCGFGCVRFEGGDYGCQMGDDVEMQFCAPVPMPLSFPSGDTLVTARVRDRGGNLGAPAQLIVRVAPP